MINIKDASIEDILPSNLIDANTQAFSYAIKLAVAKLIMYADKTGIFCNIDNLSEDALDMQAEELRTQYYADDLDIEVKRRLVKNTLSWYMKAGTPAAVRELIESVFGSGNVSEWFNYNGQPYYFKAGTNEVLKPGMLDNFTAMIHNVKNARSKLDAVTVNRKAENGMETGCAFRLTYKSAPIRMEE